MSEMGDLIAAWQKQQEAFWASLSGAAEDTSARDWFEQWSRIAGAPAAFAQLSAADVFVAPFRAAFGKDGGLQPFFALGEDETLFSRHVLGEDQVRHLSDYWVGLLHLPTSKLAVEQALNALAGMKTFHELCKLNPLLADSGTEHWEKVRAGWQTMLQSYTDLLDLYGGYSSRVADRLVTGIDAHQGEIKSVKAMFDLWVQAAEAVHDEIAATSQYRQAFGRFVNELCLTVKLQREATDAFLERIGVPTSSELTDVHARIQRLRRDQRRLRADLGDLSALLSAAHAEVQGFAKLADDSAAVQREQRKLRGDLSSVAASAAATREEIKKLRESAVGAAELGDGLAAAQQEIAQLRRELTQLAAKVGGAGSPVPEAAPAAAKGSPPGKTARRAAKPKRVKS